MTDRPLNKAKIDEIATNLNDGHREAAMKGVNLLTASLINTSEYSADFRKNHDKILGGDGDANRHANLLFDRMAGDERQLWKAIETAAEAKNPNGLCRLTIVNDAEMGPHAEIRGAKCH